MYVISMLIGRFFFQLIPVKNEQKFEPYGSSIDSMGWHSFERRRLSFENTRSPLRKLPDAKIVKPASINSDNIVNAKQTLVPQQSGLPSKRERKQKRLNPDEVYYYSSFTKNKRRLPHSEVDASTKKKPKILDGHD